MFADRKTSYKLPPTTIRDKLVSQEARRNKALEEQKRRRAQKIDSARQLDIFAGLNLGGSDEEEDEDGEPTYTLSPASVAQYASMLVPESQDPMQMNAITSPTISSFPVVSKPPGSIPDEQGPSEAKKKSKKRKGKKRSNKPSKWADKCMYAELLEMVADVPWSVEQSGAGIVDDGLPKDLESRWVAVAPVPVGKRCLAVTHQSAGVAGIVPNTTLRSRLLGKTLIKGFPSSLPPMTILDCILDANWRDNGILHVLDVVKWKGQDVADCDARFRFWWRDTRLAELAQTVPPSTSAHSNFVAVPKKPTLKYHFPYPTTFIPVPYYANTSLSTLNAEVVPAARTVRAVNVCVPVPPEVESGMGVVEPIPSTSNPFTFQASLNGSTNIADANHQQADPPPSFQPSGRTTTMTACVQPDGLLLYVAEASYEPGTSPLSSWVPISGYDEHGGLPEAEGPLDLFQRLVQRRLAGRMVSGGSAAGEGDVEMDI